MASETRFLAIFCLGMICIFTDTAEAQLVIERANTNDATFHVAGNWSPAVTPSALDTIVFDNSAPNYDVLFNNTTGDRTVAEVVVQSDDVDFANPFNSTRHVLTVTGNVVVAEQGELTVQGIEVASGAFGFVTGTLNVGGAFLPGSSFTTSGDLLLETAIFNITDLNTVSTTDVITGGDAVVNSLSNVVVEDNGSEWAIAGELQINRSTVTVTDAATLRSNGATIEGVPATVTIDGSGSQWINTGSLTSDNLAVFLRIDDGASATVDGQITNSGNIHFGGTGGTLIASNGIVNFGNIMGTGTSEIQGFVSNAFTIATEENSTLTITGDVINSALFLNAGLAPEGTIRIEGAYNGGATNGAAVPGTVELAGDYDPANVGVGQETGTARFQGVSLRMESSTNTNIQLASTSDFDLIEVFFDGAGAEPDLTLDGHLNVELLGGFQLAAGQSFEIIDYDTFGVVGGGFANAAEGDVVLTDNGFDLVVRYELTGETGRVLLETVVAGSGDPPANDNFANTISAGTFPFTLNGTNVDATVETGELQLAQTGATVWWFFTAPEDGTVTIDTFGSDFDTQLHIFDGFFSGATVADLNPVVNNDDSSGTPQSQVTFAVTSGTFYEIRVGGFGFIGGDAQGSITLNGTFEPDMGFVLGDVNCDGVVNLLDVQPFVELISNGLFNPKADINEDGVVNLLDVGGFIELVGG